MLIDQSSNIMSNLIHGENGFQMDRAVKSYLYDRRHNDVHGLGAGFYDKFIERFDTVQNSEPVRTAKAIYRRIISGIENILDNRIVELTTIGRMQNPPPLMYKYLVANPTIRELRDKDRIVGYSDEYNDPYIGVKNIEEIKEYRHVINGIYQKIGGKILAKQYFETTDNESKISVEEQFDIFYSWSNINTAILTGKDDPTDKDNGPL